MLSDKPSEYTAANIQATCRHCGHSDKLSEFNWIATDKGMGATVLITCPNKDCDALDDPGVWLSTERGGL